MYEETSHKLHSLVPQDIKQDIAMFANSFIMAGSKAYNSSFK
jgi:hypothetical protein